MNEIEMSREEEALIFVEQSLFAMDREITQLMHLSDKTPLLQNRKAFDEIADKVNALACWLAELDAKRERAA